MPGYGPIGSYPIAGPDALDVAEAITGTGAIAFAVSALAGVGLVEVEIGIVVPPEFASAPPRRRVRRVPAITGTGTLRIGGPALSGTGTLAITGTGATIMAAAFGARGGQTITGTGAAHITLGDPQGDGVVIAADLIDQAWAELQQKDEDELMMMLLAVL